MARFQWQMQTKHKWFSIFVVQMKEVPESMVNQLVDGGRPEPIAKAYADNGGTPWLDQNTLCSDN